MVDKLKILSKTTRNGKSKFKRMFKDNTFDSEVKHEVYNEVNGERTLVFSQTIKPGAIPPSNEPPHVSAGDDMFAKPDTVVILDGTVTDNDSNAVVVKWIQKKGPAIEPVRDENDVTIARITTLPLLQDQPSYELVYTFEAVDEEGNEAKADAKITVNAEGKPPVEEPEEPGQGNLDANGILWLVANGKQSLVEQSRDEETDDRWSGNVKGLGLGWEATMIAKSIGIGKDGHFAMKMNGGNHSGTGASKQRWYDLGLRVDGEIQTQWEGPHPKNHTFDAKEKQLIDKISKGLEGNMIGLKWSCIKVNGQQDGSPKNGGVRVRMWVDEDPLDANGKPKNNWKLALDVIDGVDMQIIDPQTFSAPDELDMEVRRSDTKEHEVYAGGLHVRAL